MNQICLNQTARNFSFLIEKSKGTYAFISDAHGVREKYFEQTRQSNELITLVTQDEIRLDIHNTAYF